MSPTKNFMALGNKKKCLASDAAAYRERKQRIPEPSDLVLVRNHTIDKQRGQKTIIKMARAISVQDVLMVFFCGRKV